ncbi:MAG: glycosyltransferase [Micrococcaceae bacterium]|uniref:glycosyltransferase n=1 Tax=Micrococcus sp. KRD153 TaxID=2729724 RepID=UPI0019D2F8D6|nr:glycosyltransferase [Micrococcaceae bacterium]
MIPTLQRSVELHPLVAMCAAHPLVTEVLVVNNATVPLEWDSPKVRVLQQKQNIYVNPAWNLGARVARGEFLAIINDDVLFDPEVFDYTHRLLRLPWVGMVGFDGVFMNRGPAPLTHRLATYEHVALGFGMFMALRTSEYTPIPEDMLIWGGDDWLFLKSPRPNFVLHGGDFATEVSVTSSSPEFQELRKKELARAERHLARLKDTRWWHAPAAALARVRHERHRWNNRRST